MQAAAESDDESEEESDDEDDEDEEEPSKIAAVKGICFSLYFQFSKRLS